MFDQAPCQSFRWADSCSWTFQEIFDLALVVVVVVAYEILDAYYSYFLEGSYLNPDCYSQHLGTFHLAVPNPD
jgi:hypothetical protein